MRDSGPSTRGPSLNPGSDEVERRDEAARREDYDAEADASEKRHINEGSVG